MYFDDEEDSNKLIKTPRKKDDCIRVLIEGSSVQGVGFRQWAVGKANSLHLRGWVRNNGQKVEAVFVGPTEMVREMIQLCYYGPPLASVKKVKEFPFVEEKTEILDDTFRQLPTV